MPGSSSQSGSRASHHGSGSVPPINLQPPTEGSQLAAPPVSLQQDMSRLNVSGSHHGSASRHSSHSHSHASGSGSGSGSGHNSGHSHASGSKQGSNHSREYPLFKPNLSVFDANASKKKSSSSKHSSGHHHDSGSKHGSHHSSGGSKHASHHSSGGSKHHESHHSSGSKHGSHHSEQRQTSRKLLEYFAGGDPRKDGSKAVNHNHRPQHVRHPSGSKNANLPVLSESNNQTPLMPIPEDAMPPGLCMQCVFSPSARYNKGIKTWYSEEAEKHPFASGAFRNVAKGVYTTGPQKGEPSVMKWFKTGHVYECTYYSLDIWAVNKALEIIDKFNADKIIDKKIKINIPYVGERRMAHGQRGGGIKVLVEPYIQNYQKFNSNSGWFDDKESWGAVMQALSHYSYHHTGRNYLLCDLQGGIYRDIVVLTDPVILSPGREFGCTDLGTEGINAFFRKHKCNKFCMKHWMKPDSTVSSLSSVKGTTMKPHVVTTRLDRPAGTQLLNH